MGEGYGHWSRLCDPGYQNTLFRVEGKTGWQREPEVLKVILVPRLKLLRAPVSWEGSYVGWEEVGGGGRRWEARG